jgi:D-lactate dehydrogenase (cytochrome)
LLLLTLLETSSEGLKALGLFSSIVGHLGDGNFHEAIMYHKGDATEKAAVDNHCHKMITRALELEGTSTVSIPKIVRVI